MRRGVIAPLNFYREWHKIPNKECVNICMCQCSWASLLILRPRTVLNNLDPTEVRPFLYCAIWQRFFCVIIYSFYCRISRNGWNVPCNVTLMLFVILLSLTMENVIWDQCHIFIITNFGQETQLTSSTQVWCLPSKCTFLNYLVQERILYRGRINYWLHYQPGVHFTKFLLI